MLRAEPLPADAVLCPSHLLGVLAERKQIAPVPKILHSAEWAGVFDLLKLREAVWGNQTMAVPFGSPVFCCYYRADLLEKLGRRPPKTWDEYQELAKLLAENSPYEHWKEEPALTTWCGTIEPLGPGWAGIVLWHARRPLRQTSRQLLGAVRHRDDGAAGVRPAVRASVGGIGGRGQTRPGRSVALRSRVRSCRILERPMRHGLNVAHGGKGREERGRGERAGRFSDQYCNW